MQLCIAINNKSMHIVATSLHLKLNADDPMVLFYFFIADCYLVRLRTTRSVCDVVTIHYMHLSPKNIWHGCFYIRSKANALSCLLPYLLVGRH